MINAANRSERRREPPDSHHQERDRQHEAADDACARSEISSGNAAARTRHATSTRSGDAERAHGMTQNIRSMAMTPIAEQQATIGRPSKPSASAITPVGDAQHGRDTTRTERPVRSAHQRRDQGASNGDGTHRAEPQPRHAGPTRRARNQADGMRDRRSHLHAFFGEVLHRARMPRDRRVLRRLVVRASMLLASPCTATSSSRFSMKVLTMS